MEKKQKQKKDIGAIIRGVASKLPRFTLSTWYFTVLFFSVMFFASLWVWWSCYYSPKPSNDVLIAFETKKEDFNSMQKKIQGAIELLKEKQANYQNVPDLSWQRELFADKEIAEEAPVESDALLVVPEGEVVNETAEGSLEQGRETGDDVLDAVPQPTQ